MCRTRELRDASGRGNGGRFPVREHLTVLERLGEVNGEGGPFLIADRALIETWRGSVEGSSEYDQVFHVGPAGGAVQVGPAQGLVWEPEGGATAVLYRLGPDRLLLQREWVSDVAAQEADDNAEGIGEVDIGSGTLAVIWSPVAWSDVWEPPAPGSLAQLSMPSMLNVGIQVPVTSGRYRCAARHTDDAYRCWVTRSA